MNNQGTSIPLQNTAYITLDTAQADDYNAFLYLRPKYGNRYSQNGVFYSFSPAQTDDVGIHLNQHDYAGNIIGYGQIGSDICGNIVVNSLSITKQNRLMPIVQTNGCSDIVTLVQNNSPSKPSLTVEANPLGCIGPERIMIIGELGNQAPIPITLNEGQGVGVGINTRPDPGYIFEVEGDSRMNGNVIPYLTNFSSLGLPTNRWKDLYLSNQGISFQSGASISVSSSGNIILSPGIDISGSMANDLIPSANDVYVIGNPAYRWKNLYLGNEGIYMGPNVHLYPIPSDLALGVYPGLDVDGYLHTNNTLSVGANMFSVASATGNTDIQGTLTVKSDFSINTDRFTVNATSGNTAVFGNFTVSGNKFTVNSTTGDTDVLGDFSVNTDKLTVNEATGDTAVLGNFAINTDKFTVDASSGDATVANNLYVSNDISGTNLLGVMHQVTGQTPGKTYQLYSADASSIQIQDSPQTGTGVLYDTYFNKPIINIDASGTGLTVTNPSGPSVILENTGVTSVTAGTGIGVDTATGGVTINNTGVTSINAGSGISISQSTGDITISSTVNAPRIMFLTVGLPIPGVTNSIVADTPYQINSDGYRYVLARFSGGGGYGASGNGSVGGGGGGAGYLSEIQIYNNGFPIEIQIGGGGIRSSAKNAGFSLFKMYNAGTNYLAFGGNNGSGTTGGAGSTSGLNASGTSGGRGGNFNDSDGGGPGGIVGSNINGFNAFYYSSGGGGGASTGLGGNGGDGYMVLTFYN